VQTPTARTATRLAIEYLLITLPIVIYATLEAIHQHRAALLLLSPEWSIATIFLALQTVRLFVEGMDRLRGRLLAVVLVIVQVVLISSASINIYMGLEAGIETQSWPLLATRWALLAIASLFFVCFAGSAIWSEEREATAPGSHP
jgi:hypothetical protein